MSFSFSQNFFLFFTWKLKTHILFVCSFSFLMLYALYFGPDKDSLQVLNTLEEIQERHDAVKEIERKLLDLHQVVIFNSIKH